MGSIFVNPSITSSVIRVGGVCYKRIGPSAKWPDILAVDDKDKFGSCDQCLRCGCRFGPCCYDDNAKISLPNYIGIFNFFDVTQTIVDQEISDGKNPTDETLGTCNGDWLGTIEISGSLPEQNLVLGSGNTSYCTPQISGGGFVNPQWGNEDNPPGTPSVIWLPGWSAKVTEKNGNLTIHPQGGIYDAPCSVTIGLGVSSAICPESNGFYLYTGVQSSAQFNENSVNHIGPGAGTRECMGACVGEFSIGVNDCVRAQGGASGHGTPFSVSNDIGLYDIHRSVSATLKITSEGCCMDASGNCVHGMADVDGKCLATPLAGAFASIEGPVAIVPAWQLQRSAEIYLPTDAIAPFVADCAEAGEVMGDKIAIPRDRWNKLAEKWRSRMIRRSSSTSHSPSHESECPHGLGTLARKGISLVSLGMAKPLAMAVAKVMGAKNCGCEAREQCLNRLVPDVAKVGGLEWVKLAPRIFACLGTKSETM